MTRSVFAVLVVLTAILQADDYHVIPFDVDPPVAIDGRLEDWATIPNALELKRPELVTFGAKDWTGPNDLSATIRLAWRHGGLFVAATVTDDVVFQELTGRDMFKGDHLEVYVDLTPGVEEKRTAFGRGQFQFGISPGSLGEKIGGQILPAEVHIWRPEGLVPKGAQVAARRLPNGYQLEAFIPFAALGSAKVSMHQDVNFEVALSDCDGAPPSQDTMITSSPAKWAYSRKRLVPAVFGDGNGKAPAPTRELAVAASLVAPPGKTASTPVTTIAIPKEKDAFLYFQARLHRPRVAGFRAGCLSVGVNGTQLDGKRISNRPRRSMWMSGKESVFVSADGRLTVPYTPSPRAYDRHPTYALTDNVKGCDFEFRISDLLKPGENTVDFRSRVVPQKNSNLDITIENVAIRLRPKGAAGSGPKPAPTGPLDVFEPQPTVGPTYTNLTVSAGTIRFAMGQEKFEVNSRFSLPDGKWATASNDQFTHQRTVTQHSEWIEVRDTFVNRTDQDLPIIQIHNAPIAKARRQRVWLSSLEQFSGTGRLAVPSNPSAFTTVGKVGVGILPLNDVFRIHGIQETDENGITIADREFYLPPGKTYTAEWAIVPVAKPDMWAFVNATRRLLDANFTNQVQFAFLAHREAIYKWSDDLFRAFVERKNADVICQALYFAKWNGRLPHGLAFDAMSDKFDYYRDMGKRLRKTFPDGSVHHGVYYHCFLDVMDENMERFKDCRRIDAAGNHMGYSGKYPYLMLYVPTLENDWGKAVAKGIDIRLDDLKADAFYWDEYNQSRGAYTYNMEDGCSASIDQNTHAIKRKKGAVHLLSLPFLKHHISRIQKRGVPFVGNGAPYSRSLAQLKFQTFTETGSISNCHKTILHSPVALGDHITERTLQDAYDVMLRALHWGCIYNWYSGTIIPKYKTITEHMFPFTPIELHSGYVVGKERILTAKSGLFGWGDDAAFDIHVYDRTGRETKGSEAKRVLRDGKAYAEIRIAEGYSAAIVRR